MAVKFYVGTFLALIGNLLKGHKYQRNRRCGSMFWPQITALFKANQLSLIKQFTKHKQNDYYYIILNFKSFNFYFKSARIPNQLTNGTY